VVEDDYANTSIYLDGYNDSNTCCTTGGKMNQNQKKALIDLFQDMILKIEASDKLGVDAPKHKLEFTAHINKYGFEHKDCCAGDFEFAMKGRFGISGRYLYVLEDKNETNKL
jgi:hypothetical protein